MGRDGGKCSVVVAPLILAGYQLHMVRHLITDLDLTAEEQAEIIDLAIAMKADKKAYAQALEGLVLGMKQVIMNTF